MTKLAFNKVKLYDCLSIGFNKEWNTYFIAIYNTKDFANIYELNFETLKEFNEELTSFIEGVEKNE